MSFRSCLRRMCVNQSDASPHNGLLVLLSLRHFRLYRLPLRPHLSSHPSYFQHSRLAFSHLRLQPLLSLHLRLRPLLWPPPLSLPR
ncbi:hypothetical protein BHE74_00058070 [Ensete ventricosum]|nr:hypothetical protein BHE74_00058070 [Ensete ventricosum]